MISLIFSENICTNMAPYYCMPLDKCVARRFECIWQVCEQLQYDYEDYKNSFSDFAPMYFEPCKVQYNYDYNDDFFPYFGGMENPDD